uniref:Myosin-binding protein C, slow-type-like isoform X2 n=1 Tax=Petromyzon marinus TaxID=7757 RepID=A0AAJ7XH89_PETMA|nr:myosin-binding protein C, slow-type-like isoform X2 [Petromyzon marinus]
MPEATATAAAPPQAPPAAPAEAPALERTDTPGSTDGSKPLALQRTDTPDMTEPTSGPPVEENKPSTGIFLEVPKTGSVAVGADIIFVAKVSGEGVGKKPVVKWFKGKWLDLASKAGKHLQFKENYDRNSKIYSYEMRIIKAKESYAGSYRCEVSVRDKADTAYFDLTVEAPAESAIDLRAAFRRSSGGEDAGELDFSGLLKKGKAKGPEQQEPDVDVWELLKNAKPSEFEKIAFQYGITDLRGLLRRLKRMKREVQKSPAFKKKLEPTYQVDKGGKVRMVVELEDPNSEHKWYKNGKEIRPSGKYIMESKGLERILVISNCNVNDDAAYSIEVGDEKSCTELFVREPPVTITKHLEDKNVLAGERVELECEVSEDDAQVIWKKDGQEISFERFKFKYRLKQEGKKHTLIITEPSLEDIGTYTITANGGESKAKLVVEERQIHILHDLSNVTLKPGENAEFILEVSEDVQGKWYRDGVEVKPDKRIKVVKDGKTHKLLIEKCGVEDEGLYKFVPSGFDVSLQSKLHIMQAPKMELDMDKKTGDNTIVVVAGNKLRVELHVTGDPAPMVAGNKGERTIPPTTGRVHMEKDSLVLEVAERGDTGRYTITAQNAAGTCTMHVNIKVVDIPDPPESPAIISIGEDSCVTTWKAPLYDGGEPILGYVIERKKKQSQRWMRLNFDVWKELTYEAKAMMEGVPYEMRICAVNAIGMSLPSEPSKPFVPLAPTSEPSHLIADDITDNSICLKWKQPERIGAAGLDGYRIEYCAEGSTDWVKVNPDKLIDDTSYVVRDLPKDAKLFFRVIAVNAAGDSQPCTTSQAITIRELVFPPKIMVPRHLRQNYIKKVGETVNIVVPFHGKPRPKVTWLKDGQVPDVKQVNIRNSDNDSILFIRKSLRSDSGIYVLTVQVEDIVETANITVQIVEKPGPPVSVRIVEVWECSAAIEWVAPRDSGNCEITGYTVQKADKKTMEWFTVYEHYRRVHCTVSDLVVGNEYYFRVFAENMCGPSNDATRSKDSARIPKAGIVYRPPEYKEHDFLEAPQFTHPLVDLCAISGYNATLSCCVRAFPKPKIRWTKNKVEIRDDPKYRMFSNQGVCTLEVRKPGPYDGGVYCCLAENSLGDAMVDCKFECKGNLSILDMLLQGVPPNLIQNILDKTASEEQAAANNNNNKQQQQQQQRPTN